MVPYLRIFQVLAILFGTGCGSQASDDECDVRRLSDGREVVWTSAGCAIWEYCCENRCTTEAEREAARADPEFPDCDCQSLPEFPGDCLQGPGDTCEWRDLR